GFYQLGGHPDRRVPLLTSDRGGRLMHAHRLGRMSDGQARIGASEAKELVPDLGFISDQDYFNIQFLGRLHGSFDGRGRSVIPSHRINRDLHRILRWPSGRERTLIVNSASLPANGSSLLAVRLLRLRSPLSL